jgi:hypothetical protein
LKGKLVFAFALKVYTNFPLQAEAEALRQVASIVVSHNIPLACLASDCKICIEGILNPSVNAPWRIETLINEIKAIVESIPSASFSWVPRKANMVAHTFARWALTNRFLGFVDESSATLAVLSKITEDGCFVSYFILLLLLLFLLVLIKSFFPYLKKKKKKKIYSFKNK